MTFARVLDGADLTKVELATLYGVSRRTIHTWSCGGRPRAASYTARMAAVITTALVASIERRLLPLPGMDASRRSARIASMAKTLQALKPAPLK